MTYMEINIGIHRCPTYQLISMSQAPHCTMHHLPFRHLHTYNL
jgi:hypothetical protein